MPENEQWPARRGPREQGAEQAPPAEHDAQAAIDLHALAREIVALIKEDVRLARERRGPAR